MFGDGTVRFVRRFKNAKIDWITNQRVPRGPGEAVAHDTANQPTGLQMIRSHLLRARLFSTSASTNSPPQPRRLRLSTLVFFTSAGVLVSSYFFWPSKYRGRATFSHQPLSPSHFTPVTVTEKSQAGPDLAVLTLSIPPDSRPSDENAPVFDPIWSIFIKDDDIQVERPYTPLFGIGENGAIKLWVKRYSRGEVGRWLHSRQAGDTIEIRGPLKTVPFPKGRWDEVVMVRHPLLPRRVFYSSHSF